MGEENSFIQSPFAEKKNKKMIKRCVEKFQKKFEVYGGGGKFPPRCNLRSRNFPLPPLKITNSLRIGDLSLFFQFN